MKAQVFLRLNGQSLPLIGPSEMFGRLIGVADERWDPGPNSSTETKEPRCFASCCGVYTDGAELQSSPFFLAQVQFCWLWPFLHLSSCHFFLLS